MGYEFSILLGYPNYYLRFGYEPAENFAIKSPFEVSSEYFMAINLNKKRQNLMLL